MAITDPHLSLSKQRKEFCWLESALGQASAASAREQLCATGWDKHGKFSSWWNFLQLKHRPNPTLNCLRILFLERELKLNKSVFHSANRKPCCQKLNWLQSTRFYSWIGQLTKHGTGGTSQFINYLVLSSSSLLQNCIPPDSELQDGSVMWDFFIVYFENKSLF